MGNTLEKNGLWDRVCFGFIPAKYFALFLLDRKSVV